MPRDIAMQGQDGQEVQERGEQESAIEHGEPDHEHAQQNVLLDIEHVHVENDPRQWSALLKWTVLATIANGAFIAGLATNIYNPGIADIKQDLHAQDWQISLSLSIYILISGIFPLAWSLISELYGRKIVYITSMIIATVGCIVAALAQSTDVLIGMRCLQSLGTCSVMAVGAGTLADIFDPHERGRKMGIYYAAPLLGPSLGPVLGGILTQYLSWRSTFWFLVIWTGITVVAFIYPFRETFRKERSTTYQTALIKRTAREAQRTAFPTTSPPMKNHEASLTRSKSKAESTTEELKEIKLTFADLNPFPPVKAVLSRWNNFLVLLVSGLIFGFAYSIQYTATLTLENAYGYNALHVGLVLLAYGAGGMLGSIFGGRYSDRCLRIAAAQHTGRVPPEARLKSTLPALPLIPLAVIAYAWLAQYRCHIASICVALFACGFLSIWVYSSAMAYVVDANAGRSVMAAACNSLFRGLFAFVFAEACVPLQTAIGDGGLYSLWTGLWLVMGGMIVLVMLKGKGWREHAEKKAMRQ